MRFVHILAPLINANVSKFTLIAGQR